MRPGETVALVGPSGAGKSTVFQLLLRFYDVQGGHVRVDGVDVRDLSQSALASMVGVVSQETYLFHATIADNLRFAKPEASSS